MRAAAVAVVILSGACAPGRVEGQPVEAVEACADGAIGERCSFEGPHGPVVGICDVRADEARACVSQRRPKKAQI
jgi:hypothetical protein